MGGPPAARSRSRDELAQLLADLHDDLLAQVCLYDWMWVCAGMYV